MRDFYAHQFSHFGHRGGELFGFFRRLHERAASKLHIKHKPIEIFRELLAHDTRHDQRLGRNRPRHVTQRVKCFVGRANVGGLSDDKNADAFQLGASPAFVDMDIESRNALEFIERSAGNAEPATANHRHPEFVAGQERREHERDLVSNAAGGMLVDPGRGAVGIFQDAATFHHRFREDVGFGGRHPLEENRHGPGAHLIIGDFAVRKSRDDVGDLLGGQFMTVALFFDECRNMHGRNGSARGRSGRFGCSLKANSVPPTRSFRPARSRMRLRSPRSVADVTFATGVRAAHELDCAFGQKGKG